MAGSIQNIIFDFGNVLFDLDLPQIEHGLRRLMGAQFEDARARLTAARVFEIYEVGGMSSEEFVDAICQSVTPTLAPSDVLEVWNAIFISMPAERFPWLLQLRQQYKVFLLSNINDLHERWIADYMQREHQITDFESRYFDAVYYSHLIRLRKPNRDIYEYVLADAELIPEETVFVDDLEVNVAAARALGIRGIVKTPDLDVMQLEF